MSGGFGVFDEGMLRLEWVDQAGQAVDSLNLGAVSPRNFISLDQRYPAPSEASQARLAVIVNGKQLSLAQTGNRMSREVRLEWLRPDEINAERERCPLVYLPIGPLEWHGPHLPFGTDPLQATHTALSLAEKIGGVVHPTLYIGTERKRSNETLRDLGFKGDEWIVGMDFPANTERSYYYVEDAFAMMVRFTLEQLTTRGYRLVVIVNGHGATNQIQQLQRLAAEFTQRGPCKVLYTFDLDAEFDDDAGHATITETSAILALEAGAGEPGQPAAKRYPPQQC